MPRAKKPARAAKPAKARKPKKPKRGRSSPDFTPEEIRRATAVLVGFVGLVAFGLALTLGIRRLEGSANALASTQLTSGPAAADVGVPIVFDWPGGGPNGETWIPSKFQAALLMRARQLYNGAPVLDGDPLERIGRWLGEESGWFVHNPETGRAAVAVQRDPQGRVLVRGEWRRPFAAVRWRELTPEGMREVDRVLSVRGYPMPVAYPRDGSGLPFISGVGAGPASPDEGERYRNPWPDENVQHAIRLLHELAREPFADQVAGIDIERDNRNRLAIITRWGTRIVWGGAVGAFNPGEQTDAIKLARLRQLSGRPETGGRIDARQPLLEIWGPEVMIDDLPKPEPDPVSIRR